MNIRTNSSPYRGGGSGFRIFLAHVGEGFADELFEHRLVDVGEALEIEAGLADGAVAIDDAVGTRLASLAKTAWVAVLPICPLKTAPEYRSWLPGTRRYVTGGTLIPLFNAGFEGNAWVK